MVTEVSPLGVIAGGGTLPRRIIDAQRKAGRPVFVIALRDQCAPETVADVPHVWIRMGGAGEGFARLRAAGVREVVMAGPVRRPSLLALRPDVRTLGFLARVGTRMLGDDGLLRAVIHELERDGLVVRSIPDLLGDVTAAPGTWGRHAPDEAARADIHRGRSVLRALDPVDVGQAVVVQQGIVLGIEAVEGTDALITRTGALMREGPRAVLVKAAKRGQERRADLPTVGPETVAVCARAGVRGIAVAAGDTLVVDLARMVAAADDAGIFLFGTEPERTDG